MADPHEGWLNMNEIQPDNLIAEKDFKAVDTQMNLYAYDSRNARKSDYDRP